MEFILSLFVVQQILFEIKAEMWYSDFISPQ